ncbi:hypothetical protein MCOR25_004157 [Pyricularia grisea]|uniref:Alpha/beta-hydrolase n=1 Tax=Pyricularia grisea TaxID=148305 RepID=A0A6P8API1_PYRGI|nr:hypothetical protein PgNI_11236 [Pyricularia grisea]KAI6370613.1 hypothetical protein MCOR25_004157 [Pyricularia grisea]TLD03940.1 hypothetical protein PgNI_11236 [Pyricularia grisea]
MKFTFVTSLLATAIIAFPLEARQNISTGTGSGKFPAHYTTDHTLTKHTIYMPIKPSPDVKLPVVVWGNGACLANGLRFQDFLTEVASHGYIAIASGAPNGTGETTSKWMTHSIDWVVKHAGKGKYATVDAKRIVAAGQSCGGLEAYDQKNDPRIRGLGIFNSGLRNNTNAVANITKPVFYFMGGPTDIAYANGECDYKNLPAGTPKWIGNQPFGHTGTYRQPYGGTFGVAAVKWLDWVLKGNATAANFFKGDGAVAAGWTVESKNLDKIPVAAAP